MADEEGGVPVRLAVYDISHGWARRLSRLCLCRHVPIAPHTGVLIYGEEYFWSGGLQKMSHEAFMQSWRVAPYEIVELGQTSIPEDLFHDFILNVTSRYTQHTYDILDNNCNSFCEECVQFLLGRSIPQYIHEAPAAVRASCVGRCALGVAALPASSRALGLLFAQWLCALAGLLALATARPARADCPASPGIDSTLKFGLVALGADLVYTSWLLAALGTAVRRRVVVCVPARALEVVATVVLALLVYACAVGLATLRSTLGRLFAEECADVNAHAATGCAFAWVLLLLAPISRLLVSVPAVVAGLDGLDGAAAAEERVRLPTTTAGGDDDVLAAQEELPGFYGNLR